ncbi:MAG TPA: excalibur calcium-binding domain-containing protein [Solirubrobacterales bacterium]|nr:excalibur calcium-binding domain-containing protein [Solirubrobacterales bacterium]
MRMKAFAAAAAAALTLGIAAPPAMAADKDCSDFSTWRAAQKFYKRHGGPRRDPHRLDADRDGIACESLRY